MKATCRNDTTMPNMSRLGRLWDAGSEQFQAHQAAGSPWLSPVPHTGKRGKPFYHTFAVPIVPASNHCLILHLAQTTNFSPVEMGPCIKISSLRDSTSTTPRTGGVASQVRTSIETGQAGKSSGCSKNQNGIPNASNSTWSNHAVNFHWR